MGYGGGSGGVGWLARDQDGGSFFREGRAATMASWAPLHDDPRRFIHVLATICLVICFTSPSSDARCFVQGFQVVPPPPRILHSATSFGDHRHGNQARPFGTQRKCGAFRENVAPPLSLASNDHRSNDDKNTKSAAKMAPLWATLAATAGLIRPETIGPTLGSLPAVSTSLSVLMLAMGLTTPPRDVRSSLSDHRSVLLLNILCCFIMMPLLAMVISQSLPGCSPQVAAGTIILGSVGGGQASNLFALLAGGNVSLSVVCTLSTTILGVAATPLVIGTLLGKSIPIDGVAVLKSTARLVLAPLCAGIALSGVFPNLPKRIPTAKLGISAMMILCAGGAANSAASLLGSTLWKSAVACSVLLPVVGGAVALALANVLKIEEKSKRTLVVEVLSKSPTVAYVIALRHFDAATATVPSAGMVSLAILGALVASIWSNFAVKG